MPERSAQARSPTEKQSSCRPTTTCATPAATSSSCFSRSTTAVKEVPRVRQAEAAAAVRHRRGDRCSRARAFIRPTIAATRTKRPPAPTRPPSESQVESKSGLEIERLVSGKCEGRIRRQAGQEEVVRIATFGKVQEAASAIDRGESRSCLRCVVQPVATCSIRRTSQSMPFCSRRVAGQIDLNRWLQRRDFDAL